MSPVPRRRKDARPAELLEAALEVFAEKGFAAARMEDIAARAGAAKGTIYLYFPSKEAVFEALVRSAIVPNLERAEALAAAHQGPVAPLLRELMGLLETMIRDSRLVVLPRLMIGELYKFPELARFYRATVIDRGLGLIAAMHRKGVEQGEFRPEDSDAVARLVIAPVLLMAIWRTVFAPYGDEPFDPAPVLRAHVEILLRGLAP
ncbi:TetR/AcrR family transcriptional regulator [Benzoatithermus flavus]|uniref:TetR/AcrR family transcriptional regulator n=1 Tax=Benzoatithermus flavus TaxID=3108223 RepID=A0ABU8XK03_9PROT